MFVGLVKKAAAAGWLAGWLKMLFEFVFSRYSIHRQPARRRSSPLVAARHHSSPVFSSRPFSLHFSSRHNALMEGENIVEAMTSAQNDGMTLSTIERFEILSFDEYHRDNMGNLDNVDEEGYVEAPMGGEGDESFEKLPAYMDMLKESNFGSIVHWDTSMLESGKVSLNRVFWSFAPAIEGFKHCRPVISIDATHLIGKWKDVLMIAVSLDAENEVLPLAYALVESEIIES
ncbi:hypothetical protein QQ045_010876 [Rhodiola kirilowii]